jgi:hypothetical protein
MDNSYSSDDQLIPFLRELANSIELKQLHSDQLKKVGEFYMSYKLNVEGDNCDNDLEEMDIIKFLTMGWYMYKHILSSSSVETNSTDPFVTDPE